ncbi:MAG: tetratricopeptide repeat protein [Candidatus Zixiibacteriota bacterium]
MSDRTEHKDKTGKEKERPSPETAPDNDQLEFRVTEKMAVDHEFVGGRKRFSSESDDLGIQSNSDLMDEEAHKTSGIVDPSFYQPEDFAEDDKQDTLISAEPVGSMSAAGDLSAGTARGDPYEGKAAGKDEFKKLSAGELAGIEKDLYAGNSYLTDREREELMSKLDQVGDSGKPADGFTSSPEEPVTPTPEKDSDLVRPRMAQRARGIAYYYRNYIQVVGRHELSVADELFIGDRPYDLRPKRFDRRIMLGVAGGLFVVLLFIVASLFVSDTGTGQGEIIGMVLDENGAPYVQQATIKFPQLGRTTNSNRQGYFRSGPVKEGTHRIEYYLGENLAGAEYATVVAGEITTLSLAPDPESLVREPSQRAALSAAPPEKPRTDDALASKPTPITKPTARGSERTWTESGTRKPVSKDPAKVTLAANVEGAMVSIDGQVLGAGNLTYSDVSPGKHRYAVSKDGFETVSGTIELAPGETRTLTVELTPLTQAAKAETFDHQDYYYSATAALEENDPATALKDLNAAIELKPSYAEAYVTRAEVHRLRGDRQAAHDDLITAAEIFQFRKDYNQAITSYNKAIELNEESVTAYLGRARTYMAKKEEIAAIADFENVTRLDRRNFDAHYGLGEARFLQGQYKTASKHFKDARSLERDNPFPYQYLMLCYLAMDNINEVRKSYEKFRERASEQQMSQMRQDSRFAAVLRIVDDD